MNRRSILTATAWLPIGYLLAGASSCDLTNTANITQQVVTDVGLIASGLSGALPGLASAGVPADKVAIVGQYVGKIQSLASGISTSMTQNSAGTVIQQIGGIINQILAIAGPMVPPPWGTAIMAAEVLLPVIEAAVGMAVPAAPMAAAMTPDAARAALRATAK